MFPHMCEERLYGKVLPGFNPVYSKSVFLHTSSHTGFLHTLFTEQRCCVVSEWNKQYWKIYLDKETRRRIEEILDHLDEHYEGPSDYVQQKLMQEDALSIEERIQRNKQKKQEFDEKIERLKRIKQEREQSKKLKDKKELLKSKQEKYEKIMDEGLRSEEEIRQEKKRKRKERGHDLDDPEIQEYIDRSVQRELEKQPDVNELIKDIKRLQSEVEELESQKDWFIEEGKLEVAQVK